ncbi:MAG TPA: PAS domain S-box protein, partial [Ideonella sp.]|nr:PAS domain S-box protein [Ideonella sp.]
MSDHPTAPSTSVPNFLLRQQARRFGQVAALAFAAFLILGLANLWRGNPGQGGTLMAAALATGLALRLHERQRTANAAFALTLTCIVVVCTTSWMGGGLMDTGNFAFPGILVLASLLMDRARFIVCVGLVMLALAAFGGAAMLGWRQWPSPAVGPWHLLDIMVITLTTAGVAALVVEEIRRAIDAMQAQQAALHQSTERLAASEARFRGLFETAPVGLARLDAQGFIVDTNDKLCELLGREHNSLAGLRPEQLCLAADWPRLRNSLAQRDIPGLDPAPLELRLTHADGHPLEVRINLTRRSIGHGGGQAHGDAAQGTMLSVEDVTPHRRIRQLEHDKAAAEAMTRAQTEFLSRMSHELRTPLNA